MPVRKSLDCTLAVKKIKGVTKDGSFLSAVSNENPSISGIIISQIIKSKGVCMSALIPAAPFAMGVTAYPAISTIS